MRWLTSLARLNLLGGVRSIKLKLSILLVAAIGIAVVVSNVGVWLGWPYGIRLLVAVVISLVMVQLLAGGTTRPLREMEEAVAKMTEGDYRHRVETSSVDEVGRLASAFNVMSADLAKVDRERRDLIANVSHELRTPLTALRAQLENMIDGVSEPSAEKLAAMHGQTERLELLVRRVMDLANIESGQTTLHVESVEVAGLLVQAVAEAELRNPGAQFRLVTDPGQRANLDPLRFGQVVANLLDNAATHGGDAVVTVDATVSDGTFRMEVADLGPGLSAQDAERVFERFYRAEYDRASASGGSGLGLAIAQGIVALHGGTIDALVNHPSGCRMVVQLPANAIRSGDRATPADPPLPPDSPLPPGDGQPSSAGNPTVFRPERVN